MRFALVLWGILASTVASGQVATWNGRTYTPNSFPKATWHNCSMCASLRSQWASQVWGQQRQPAKVVFTQSSQPANQASYELVQRTRQVYVPRVCHGTYCTPAHYRTETYWERVPVASSITSQSEQAEPVKREVEYQGTDPAVAAEVMRLLAPKRSDVLVDLGCGDGQLLLAAAPYECRLVGIEIDAARANQARRLVPSAKIVTGDMRKQQYAHGTIYVCYRFPDLIAEVAELLPRGAILASIDHDVPGLAMHETQFAANGQLHSLWTGRIE